MTIEKLSEKYSLRYLNYCAANQKFPEDMLSHDKKRWKGGSNTGYILWVNEKISEYSKNILGIEYNAYSRFDEQDNDNFQKWLDKKYDWKKILCTLQTS